MPDLFPGPDEGHGSEVVCFDGGVDPLLELFEVCEGSAAERLSLQDRKQTSTRLSRETLVGVT